MMLMSLASCSGNNSGNDAAANKGEAAAQNADEAAKALKWWQSTIACEVYPKSYLDTKGEGTGTLAGITKKLDYLAELGVGAIWLTPVCKSPNKDGGYDVADYYDIDPRFGTMADMDELIAEAKKHDIRIVMDLVMNHSSNENEWFKDSEANPEGEHGDWYIWQDAKKDKDGKRVPPTNWRGIFGGSAWTWSEKRGQYYLHTFADFQPDMNWECEALRKELFKMAKFWLDKGVGGFRIDAIPYIKKPAFVDAEPDGEADGLSGIHAATVNTDGILDYLNEFKNEVMAGTDAFTVGEANGVKPEELPQWVGENGVFDMVFEFAHVLVPQGGNEIWYKDSTWKLTELKKAFAASQKNTENSWYPVYLENHDQPRSVNSFTPDCEDKVAAGKMLGTILLTMRGTPFVYQGEELGFANAAMASIDDYDDANARNQYDLAIGAGKTPEEALAAVQKCSRDNARTPMQWDTTENAGFTTGKPWLPVHDDYKTVNAEVEEADENSVLNYYRKLSKLRSENPVLLAGDYTTLLEDSEEIFAFQRACGEDKAVTLTNFTGKEVTYDASLVKGMKAVISSVDDPEEGKLRPWEGVVYVSE